MRSLVIAFFAALLIGCATAQAQPEAGPFSPFAGAWSGRGQFQGAPSQVSANFQPLFDGAAWRLDVDIRFAPANGAPQRFRGQASYALSDGALNGGSWIDNAGNAYALAPRFQDGALIVGWGGGQMNGRSEYRIEGDGDLVVTDSIETAQGWRPFARAELQRGG